MKCLHLCNDLMGSRVHLNLYDELNLKGIEQSVFCPYRTKFKDRIDELMKHPSIGFHFSSRSLQWYHRYLFKRKIKFLYKELLSTVDINTHVVIHASTLFSDGALALQLRQEFGIPYVVNIRATDVDLFFKYFKHLHNLGAQILKNASAIVVLTPVLRQKLFKFKAINNIKSEIDAKIIEVPNAIDEFWITNRAKKRSLNTTYKVLFVGRSFKRKNALNLANAITNLSKNGHQITLTIVGRKGNQHKALVKLQQEFPEIIQMRSPLANKQELANIYRSHHLLAMPSIGESFGLVYLEAISQGLPILLLKGEGIDGLFDAIPGIRCKNADIPTLEQALLQSHKKYGSYDPDRIDLKRFSWPAIAEEYKKLYQNVTQNLPSTTIASSVHMEKP